MTNADSTQLMELALNALWLALSALALGAWFRGRQRRPVVGTLALCGALLLLFPVISATDDVCAAQAAAEEASAGRAPALRSARGDDSDHAQATPACGCLPEQPVWSDLGAAPTAALLLLAAPALPQGSGRAPPLPVQA